MNEAYSEQDIERCTLTSAQEIAFQIKCMIKRGDKVSVVFHEGRQGFLTVLIEVSPGNGVFYFGAGGNEEINRAFLKAGTCTFMTFVEGVRLQFPVEDYHLTQLRGDAVFAAPIPATMLRLQRRDTFRLSLPGSRPFTCRIRRGTPEEELLTLRDISVTGIGIFSTTSLDHEQLEMLEDCWLDLHENGMIHCSLEVRYVKAVESRAGKPLCHMGCRFVNLRSADEMRIQRFLARMEAERLVAGPG